MAINALWVGIHLQDPALMTILVPALVLALAPAKHTKVLATVSTLAAIATAIVPPLAGALSDNARRRGGDRRLQTAIILAIDTIALVVLPQTSTIVDLGAGGHRRHHRANERVDRLSGALTGTCTPPVLGAKSRSRFACANNSTERTLQTGPLSFILDIMTPP